MPTGIEEALLAIVGGISAVVAWFNSLPATLKYLIFLSGLLADAGVVAITGFGNGIIATPINLLIQYGFGFPLFQINSWQLLIVFIMLPIMFYCLKN